MRALRLVLHLLLWPAVLLLASVSAAAAIAAQWGRVSLRLDLLAHFAPVWLAGAAAALALSFLFRRGLRWSIAGISLAGIACSLGLIAPEVLRDAGPRAAAGAPGALKIVQFNVWYHNPDPAAVLRWLETEDPDIAVIEENSPRFRAALKDQTRWIVSCGRCEVMMLSKRSPLQVQPARRRRGRELVAPLTRAVFADAAGRFELIGVHNAWPNDDDQPIQEDRLAAVAGASSAERLIIAGDFNSTPWSFARRRWDRTLGIPRRTRALATWPGRRYGRLRWLGAPFLPIDHVYAGPGWATVEVRRGPRLSSDHYPLVVTLAPVAPR
jgi:endonuclease/exonuclease/phosphatase (EEP) superfamily protein YafD